MYTCIQARDHHWKHVYMIYSAKVSDLMCKESDSKPNFILEKIIYGSKYMGCGVYDSKIVFAGGISDAEREKNAPKRSKYNLKLITYDPVSKNESREDFPQMRGRKIRPLVFEICNRLYVLDTSSSAYNWGFEFLNPTGNFWDPLMDPYHNWFSGRKKRTVSGRTPYAWFVAGNVACISAHRDDHTYFHHAKSIGNGFLPKYMRTLPFRGMAITYFDPNFSDDVVLISFSGANVEGRRLNLESSNCLGTPTEIFKTDPCKPDGELSIYFADCGDGVFCLTTFDKANMHVYTFEIHRLPPVVDSSTLNLHLERLEIHKYRFSEFNSGLNRSVSISGCFALPNVDRAKRIMEAQLYADLFRGLYTMIGQVTIRTATIQKQI